MFRSPSRSARAPRLALCSLASAFLPGCGGPAATTPSPSLAPPPPLSIVLAPSAPATPDQVAQSLEAVHVLPSAHNLVENSGFDDGRLLPWMATFAKPAEGSASVRHGAYCLDVKNPGRNAWDVQIWHRRMTIQKGHTYSIRFKIASTGPTTVLAQVAMSGPPYKAYWRQTMELGLDPKLVTSAFTMPGDDDATAQLAFQAGGRDASARVPFDVCVDDVVLEDPAFSPKSEPPAPPVPNVLVNQVGYEPDLPKVAIVKSDAAAPLAWQVLDRAGRIVASGVTTVHGPDEASGDRVHAADFSALAIPGRGYTLRVGDQVSHPFDIEPDIYEKLKYDALHYFYHSRSGTPIAMPWAGDPKWVRPAGHLGDKSVSCAPDAPCDYALDVSGGWYDAGDHGKYVVSGAVATWTLLDLYERTKALGTSIADFGDGKMNIPEGHDGVPDLLDEARWELEFLLRMQVPEGKPLAGMVHHKIHDKEWTGLATRPDQDTMPRFLRPVSTAATLDMAAVAAQGARVFERFDRAFAERCLRAAERAWAAAVANPAMFITAADAVGGGAYADDDVSDEFYWAASELRVTTNKAVYADFVAKSPHESEVPFGPGDADRAAMTWQHVAALGTISTAVVPSGLPKKDVAAARKAIAAAADAYLDVDRREGYRVPFSPDASGKYPWGSNSFVLDDAVVEALAWDFTKDAKYLTAVDDAMSYVLGRNPMDQSYVTGYGFRPLRHPHHRFWAHEADAAFPSAPPGVLSGGPNSGLEDPYVQAAGLAGCAPMKCYADDIEAWSANEEAINWNAPLAWVAAFLDERPSAGARPRGRTGGPGR